MMMIRLILMTRRRRRRRRRLALLLLLLLLLAHPPRKKKATTTAFNKNVSLSLSLSLSSFGAQQKRARSDEECRSRVKIRSGKIGRKKKQKSNVKSPSHSAGCIADPLSCHPPPPPKKKRYSMPPPRRKSSLSSNDDAAKKKKPSEEEEDRHAVEMLRRLEDLGVDLPSKSMAPNALRNHKRDPLGFVAIASQLATIIEPLIEMTGADNPTLARRSCETIRTLGPGTSEEDRASRALGALAVVAVGQMECIQFSNSSGETTSRRRRLRRPFFFATEERENNRAGCGGRFSLLVDIDIIDKSLSPPRSVRRVLYKSPIDDYHDSSFPLFSNCFFLHRRCSTSDFETKSGRFACLKYSSRIYTRRD